jgi:hypothetical protein
VIRGVDTDVQDISFAFDGYGVRAEGKKSQTGLANESVGAMTEE